MQFDKNASKVLGAEADWQEYFDTTGSWTEKTFVSAIFF